MTPPTVLKFYLTLAPFLTERFLSISSQPHACFFLPFPLSISSEQAAGSLSPSARSEQAGTSVRRAPGREQARPRAGGDERASGREQVRLRARAGGDELAPGRPASCRRVRSQAHAAGDRPAATARPGVGGGRQAAARTGAGAARRAAAAAGRGQAQGQQGARRATTCAL